jgi:hypothetical protein
VPQNGSAARFDDLGLFVFASEDEARAFADTYGQPPPSAHATRGPQKKAVPSAATCRETATVREEPSKDTSPTNRFGAGPWYVNADRTIWAHAAHARYWMPGSYGNKVLWIRPKGHPARRRRATSRRRGAAAQGEHPLLLLERVPGDPRVLPDRGLTRASALRSDNPLTSFRRLRRSTGAALQVMMSGSSKQSSNPRRG